MSEETESNGLIIGGVVLVAVGFLCVGLVMVGFLFFGSSARSAHPLKKPAHSPVALIVDFDLTDPNQAKIEKAIRKKLEEPEGELTMAHLDKVTGLSLRNNQLTDVKGLEKLNQLTELRLSGNQLTDVKGLEKLTQLEQLWLNNNPDLTKAQIDELQKALPKCKISSNPTK